MIYELRMHENYTIEMLMENIKGLSFLRIGGGEMVKKRERIAAYFIVFSRI